MKFELETPLKGRDYPNNVVFIWSHKFEQCSLGFTYCEMCSSLEGNQPHATFSVLTCLELAVKEESHYM
jgi:hypothetical protein